MDRRFSLLLGFQANSGALWTSNFISTGGAVFPGVKQQGREADHSTSSSANIKIKSSYTFSSHMPSWCAQCQLLSECVQHLINRGTDTCFGKRMPNGSDVFGSGLKWHRICFFGGEHRGLGSLRAGSFFCISFSI